MNLEELKKAIAAGSLTPIEIAKAVNEMLGLRGIKEIDDLWDDMHGIPSAKETTTGPSMVSSGGGAVHAMREYSNPAPQVGITKEYEALAGHTATYEDISSLVKSIKELNSTIKTSKSEMQKDPDPDPDKKSADASAKDPDPDPDHKGMEHEKEADCKAMKARLLTPLYSRLAKAEAETANVEHEKEHDKEKMHEAKSHLEKAEQYIESLEMAKSESAVKIASLSVEAALGKVWEALSKARPVERHGLKGDGNQSDTAIPGSVREATEKARYWNNKLARMKGEVVKDPDPDPDPDKKAGEASAKDPDPDPDHKAMGKDPDPDPDPDKKGHESEKGMYCARLHGPEESQIKSAINHFMKSAAGSTDPANVGAHKAVKDALRRYAGYLKGEVAKDPDPDPDPDHKGMEHEHESEKALGKDPDPDPDPDKKGHEHEDMEKASAQMKAMNERMRLIEQNIASQGNRPTITPVILSKASLNTDAAVEKLHDRVAEALDNGHLSTEEADIADSIIARSRAAQKGDINPSIVEQQLSGAPIPVRNFFEQINGLPN